MPRRALPKLPQLLKRKLYKTGQTRGADDDEIYQNRVSRASTALIPFAVWVRHFTDKKWCHYFENGFIVLISPDDYFGNLQDSHEPALAGLELGHNALVFYETRMQWNRNHPQTLGWKPAQSRRSPLGGQYVARIPATTATDNTGGKIVHGFNTTANKGAGIRVYEYADRATIQACCLQLEMLFWNCRDSEAGAVANGMPADDAATRRREVLDECKQKGLLDIERLTQARILNGNSETICPLCLLELSSHGFFSLVKQAPGREVSDLTITQINLFHIEEVRMGEFNHRPYNLGWGHHHCNVVVKDAGINETLRWMDELLRRNAEQAYLREANNGN